jgi:cytoskeletal protein CcmA (bactofilin family)
VCHNTRTMSLVGKTIVVRGEVSSADDLLVDGRIDGPIWTDGLAVVIAPAATVTGDIVARDITIMGTVTGTLLATDVVDVRASACVTGRVLAPRFILDESASFNGQVQPHHLEAALRVARHRHDHPSG